MLRELLLPLQNLMLSDEDIPSFGEVFGFFLQRRSLPAYSEGMGETLKFSIMVDASSS